MRTFANQAFMTWMWWRLTKHEKSPKGMKYVSAKVTQGISVAKPVLNSRCLWASPLGPLKHVRDRITTMTGWDRQTDFGKSTSLTEFCSMEGYHKPWPPLIWRSAPTAMPMSKLGEKSWCTGFVPSWWAWSWWQESWWHSQVGLPWKTRTGLFGVIFREEKLAARQPLLKGVTPAGSCQIFRSLGEQVSAGFTLPFHKEFTKLTIWRRRHYTVLSTAQMILRQESSQGFG